MDERIETINQVARYLRERLGTLEPKVGIILGSGLGSLAGRIENPLVVPYSEIPGFPVSTAIGHKGNFVVGTLGGKCVIAMQGRFHFYEGYPMELVTLPVRVLAVLGITHLLVSNAAGGCNPDYKTGNLVIIKDHINLFPNPMIGKNMDEFGPRFPDMTTPYDLELMAKAEDIAAQMGVSLHRGVYLGLTGPTYETPAEVRYYRLVGADLIGMSTIPEVIVARHCGLKVFGMSVVTNLSNTDNVAKDLNDGHDVVQQADKATGTMAELFTKLIAAI